MVFKQQLIENSNRVVRDPAEPLMLFKKAASTHSVPYAPLNTIRLPSQDLHVYVHG